MITKRHDPTVRNRFLTRCILESRHHLRSIRPTGRRSMKNCMRSVHGGAHTMPWPLRWLLALVVLALTAGAAAKESEAVVLVPMGSTTVLVGGSVVREIECDVLPHTSFSVDIQALNGEGDPIAGRLVEPTAVAFVAPPSPSNSTLGTKLIRTFTLFGLREGRFRVAYSITGANATLYKLSALGSVVVVTDDQGWQGIWFQLAFNGAIFLCGLAFFAWRGLHRVDLPIWERREAGLFERANYDHLAPKAFDARYREIRADTLRGRFTRFWNLPCDGHYVCHTSGIPAALLMRFHCDAGLLCAVLTFFSLGTLLPVNLLSGNKETVLPGNSFQQTTISNVPLYSDWYWVHVAYCYIVAALLLGFLFRQHSLLVALRRRTKRIVGGRSILIHAGLPPSMSGKKLRALLAEYYEPHCIEDVSVVYDFSKLHEMLDRRRELAQELDRIRGLDAGYEHGMLSSTLLWCPGSLLLPSLGETIWSWISCRPCRYYYRHVDCHCCRRAISFSSSSTATGEGEDERLTYSKISSEREIVDSGLAREIDALDEELDFFPEEAIDIYANRQCSGGAFVMFDSVATRDDFVRLVREQRLSGRFLNALHDRAYCLRYAKPPPRSPRRSFSSAFGDSPPSSSSMKRLSPHLGNLVLTSAPEPDDVLWKNLRYKPLSFWSLVSFLARQLTTLALLLLFSTPTAVLVYIKLDSSSSIYQQLYAKHTWLVELIATYLPSLLLIVVNWALLTFLYHVALLEPSISDSRRTKSFLVNGFTYLVVSSVFLPSIGVTAAYLAFSDISTHGKSYVESFLFKISGTSFFISYICQRTFLGTIVELSRVAERLVLQPWLLSRAVTVDERREAHQPWPYYYGHDYAMLTSVLLVIMLGTVITPILTPFGALFFYVKYGAVKYNFLYVKPYTPGRGHIAQTAYSLVAVALVIFELVMAFVFLQIAGRKKFAAIIVLLVATGAVYFFHIGDLSSRMKQELPKQHSSGESPLLLPSPRAQAVEAGKRSSKSSKGRGKKPLLYSPISVASPSSTAASTPPPHARRTIFSPTPANLEQDLGLLEKYTDPYKVALSIFKLLGVHEKFHTMSSSRTQLKYAFERLKRNARTATPIVRGGVPTVDEILEEELDNSLKHLEAV